MFDLIESAKNIGELRMSNAAFAVLLDMALDNEKAYKFIWEKDSSSDDEDTYWDLFVISDGLREACIPAPLLKSEKVIRSLCSQEREKTNHSRRVDPLSADTEGRGRIAAKIVHSTKKDVQELCDKYLSPGVHKSSGGCLTCKHWRDDGNKCNIRLSNPNGGCKKWELGTNNELERAVKRQELEQKRQQEREHRDATVPLYMFLKRNNIPENIIFIKEDECLTDRYDMAYLSNWGQDMPMFDIRGGEVILSYPKEWQDKSAPLLRHFDISRCIRIYVREGTSQGRLDEIFAGGKFNFSPRMEWKEIEEHEKKLAEQAREQARLRGRKVSILLEAIKNIERLSREQTLFLYPLERNEWRWLDMGTMTCHDAYTGMTVTLPPFPLSEVSAGLISVRDYPEVAEWAKACVRILADAKDAL